MSLAQPFPNDEDNRHRLESLVGDDVVFRDVRSGVDGGEAETSAGWSVAAGGRRTSQTRGVVGQGKTERAVVGGQRGQPVASQPVSLVHCLSNCAVRRKMDRRTSYFSDPRLVESRPGTRNESVLSRPMMRVRSERWSEAEIPLHNPQQAYFSDPRLNTRSGHVRTRV